MTKAMMDLRELVERSGDADLLREMIDFAAERLAQRNGYRERFQARTPYRSLQQTPRSQDQAHG